MAAILTGQVAGVDEVGRGPLAGPVVVAAVILRRPLAGLADSKQLSEARRRELDTASGPGPMLPWPLRRWPRSSASTSWAPRCWRCAVPCCGWVFGPDLVLVDGNRPPTLDVPVRCVVGGDATVPQISAASIVAKVARDALMRRLAQRYPGYGWSATPGTAHLSIWPPCADWASIAIIARVSRPAHRSFPTRTRPAERAPTSGPPQHGCPERIPSEETLGAVAG